MSAHPPPDQAPIRSPIHARPLRSRPPRRRTRPRSRPIRAGRRSERAGASSRVKPVSQTPTEPQDYAALNAVYAAALGGLVASPAGRRATRDVTTARELVPLGMAAFALSKAVAREKVSTWLREPFVEEPEPGERRPRGRGLRYAIGELLTCTRCAGAWSSLALVGLRLAAPTAGRTVTAVLATSAANDFLQAGFSRLCAQADAYERAAAEPAHPAARPDRRQHAKELA